MAPGLGLRGALRACLFVCRQRPLVLYLVDTAITTTAAGVIGWLLGCRVILDTGDLNFELERSTGERSRLGIASVRLGEALLVRLAHRVVIRGRFHAAMLPGKVTTFIPDLPPPGARPADGSAIRERLGLSDAFVVGLVGSLNRAPRLGISYGWDLVDALTHTPESVSALIVGDGPARPELELRAEALGVAHRCRFVGTVSSDDVCEWIGAMDAAISTQTNNLVGWVRTTGKLPLYLACGCPVIASDVGEANVILGQFEWTLPYIGVVDPDYPERLANRIIEWQTNPQRHDLRRQEAFRVHAHAFDAAVLKRRLVKALDEEVAAAGLARSG